MAGARLAGAVALSALLACSRAPAAGGPVPLAVVPGQGAAASAVAVEIEGRNLDAKVHTDFVSTHGTVNARFSAALDPVAGGTAVALQDVALTPRHTLRATVPAGLPLGVYRLTLKDPRGRTGVLEQAYRVVTSAEAVATFRVDVLEPPRAGIPFAVALTAVDARVNAVDSFDGTVSLSDGNGTLSPVTAGPFAKGSVVVRVTIPGVVSGARITASDALGRGGTSAPFDVIAGPPAAIVFPQRAVLAPAGACSPAVAVELRDVLAHPSPAEADVTVQLQSAPPEVRFFSDAACASAVTSLAIPAGATGASFHFLASAAGAVTLRVVPPTLPSASQDETVSP